MIVAAPDHMVSVKIVETAAHLPEPLPRISQDHLRRLKSFFAGKHPAELIIVNPHHHTHAVILCQFRLRQKISGIHKMHRVNFSFPLVRTGCNKRHKRMLLMAGFSPQGGNRLFSIAQRPLLNMPLSRPCAA